MEEAVGSTPISSTIFVPSELRVGAARTEASHTMSRALTGIIIRCALAALSLTLIAPSGAFSAASQPASPAPDVIVWVDARNQGGHWVSVTYAKVIARSEAEHQLWQLLSETGWSAANVDISDETLSAPPENPMTSVTFMTPEAIKLESGVLPVEPIVKPLRRLRTMKIIYVVPPSFTFHGLEDYENKYVKISLKRGTNTYEYTVIVKDAKFETLGLPPTGIAQRPTQSGWRRPGALALSFVAALAVFAAALTYLVTRRAARPNTGDRDQRS